MKDLEVRRQYVPDEEAVLLALRRLLREPKGEIMDAAPLGASIREPTEVAARNRVVRP